MEKSLGEELTTNAVTVAADREIVRFLAEKVMGWAILPFIAPDLLVIETLPDTRGFTLRYTYGTGRTSYMVPEWNPLESIADAFEVQAAIAEGRRTDYVNALADELWPESGSLIIGCGIEDGPETFALISATPRQRSLAAYCAMGGDAARTVPGKQQSGEVLPE